MEQLTNEQIDQLCEHLQGKYQFRNSDVDRLCDMAKEIGELAKAIHYPDCWCTTAYPTVADALAQVYATFQCTNADTHLDITRLDLIGELTSPEYISRLRGVMGREVEPFGWYYSHPTAIAASHYSHGAQRPDERAGWKPLYAALTSRAAVLEEATKNALPTVGYYLQDKRVFVGNDMMWWAKDGNGYTTDLRKAHVFTDEDYAKGCSRETDIFWPVKYINGLSRPTVDFQYANLDAAIRAAKGE